MGLTVRFPGLLPQVAVRLPEGLLLSRPTSGLVTVDKGLVSWAGAAGCGSESDFSERSGHCLVVYSVSKGQEGHLCALRTPALPVLLTMSCDRDGVDAAQGQGRLSE